MLATGLVPLSLQPRARPKRSVLASQTFPSLAVAGLFSSQNDPGRSADCRA